MTMGVPIPFMVHLVHIIFIGINIYIHIQTINGTGEYNWRVNSVRIRGLTSESVSLLAHDSTRVMATRED